VGGENKSGRGVRMKKKGGGLGERSIPSFSLSNIFGEGGKGEGKTITYFFFSCLKGRGYSP